MAQDCHISLESLHHIVIYCTSSTSLEATKRLNGIDLAGPYLGTCGGSRAKNRETFTNTTEEKQHNRALFRTNYSTALFVSLKCLEMTSMSSLVFILLFITVWQFSFGYVGYVFSS